jgi:polysaccharide chain length determinant protein (PEP-CTERM system associated)
MLPGRKYTPAHIIGILSKGKWIIAASVFVCAFTALLIARTLPDEFAAEATVQVLPQRVPDAYVRATVTSTVEERLKTIEGVIRSRTQIEQIIQDFNLFPDTRTSGSMDDAVAATNKAMNVEVAAGAGGRRPMPGQVTAFKVAFTYRDHATALKVTQRLTDVLINENSRMRESAADQTSQFLQSQLADAERRLREQDQKLEAFRQRYAGRLPNQMDSNMQALSSARLELSQLAESIARDKDRKTLLERLYQGASQDLETIAVAPATPTGGQSTDPNSLPTGGTVQQRLAQARANLEALEARFKPEHPDVKRAKSQIRELERQAAAEASARPAGGGSSESAAPRAVSPDVQARRERLREQREEIASLGRQIATKESQEAALRSRMADYQSRIEMVPGIESEYNELTRDNLTLQETYKTLLGRSEESKISANLERRQIGEQFRMLDAPRAASDGAGVRRLQVNAGGIVLGLVFGLVIIGIREFLDSTFRTEADVLNALALPVLVTVPFSATPEDVARTKRNQRMVQITAASALVVGGAVGVALQLWKYIA